MEREKAVRLLTKKLVETYGRDVIFEESHKDKLIKNSDLVYVLGDSKIVDYQRDYKKYFSQGTKYEEGKDVKKKEYDGKSIEEVLKGIIPDEANYLFASEPVHWGDSHLGINLVPYAIIGKNECSAIKERFYKGDDFEVREAVESLGIENFFWLYNLYSTKQFLTLYKMLDNVFQNHAFAEAWAQNPVHHKHAGKFKDFVKGKKDIDTINSLVKAFGVKCGVFTNDTEVCTHYMGYLMDHLNKYSDFFSFVFNLPSEEQDVETNKILLRMYPSLLSIDTILFKEYSQGNFFKEYFEVLEDYQKENVLNLLKNCPPCNPEYDSFLFSLGFKDVMNISDYRVWYENDPKTFVDAFQGESREKKIEILKEIFESNVINEDIIKWLNENELDLVREAGMS